MSVGFPVSKASVDQAIGQAVLDLQVALENVKALKIKLDDPDQVTDAKLVNLGYTQAEVDGIRAAFGDLTDWDKVGHGLLTQATARDFWAWAKRVTGVRGRF